MGWGVEGLKKKEKELMDMDDSVVIVGENTVGGSGRGHKQDKLY